MDTPTPQTTETALFLDELSQLLARMAEYHEQLTQTLQKEIDSDGQLDAAGLITLQGQKARLARLIQTQEKARMALIGRLAKAWIMLPQDLTLKTIAAKSVADFGLPQTTGQSLLDLHQRLQTSVEEIAHLAKQTATNATARSKAVGATLDAVRDTLKNHPTYSPRGRVNASGPVMRHVSA